MAKLFFQLVVVLFFGIFYGTTANSAQFVNSNYNVCFTPGEDCTKLIVNAINRSKSTIKLQAYSFTSESIAKSLVNAKKRGVDVKAILDKGQFSANYSASKFLLNASIPVWKDHRVSIAHNKIIIIDDKIVITGSFNFTKAAQERNAENVLVINDADLAEKYTENWNKRMAFSDLIANSN